MNLGGNVRQEGHSSTTPEPWPTASPQRLQRSFQIQRIRSAQGMHSALFTSDGNGSPHETQCGGKTKSSAESAARRNAGQGERSVAGFGAGNRIVLTALSSVLVTGRL